jgi:hypothetical protein
MAIKIREANEGGAGHIAREKQELEVGFDSQRLAADAIQGSMPLKV